MRDTRQRIGASLLEIVAVVGLLGFCLLPLVMMSRGGIARTEHAMNRVLAVNLSNRIVDRFAAMPYPQLKDLVSDSDFSLDQDPLLAPATLPESLRERLAGYTKTLTFREEIPDALGVLDVRVEWKSQKGGNTASLRAIRVVMNP